MPATQPCVPSCCSTSLPVQIPGIAGDDGLDGSNGIDAFTATTQNFIVPAVGAQVGVSVGNSSWMVVGQNVIVTGPANFVVAATPTTTSATLTFLGYPGDVVPNTVIGAGATVAPAGQLGGGWNPLVCVADQAIINSAALANSLYMQFNMAANTNYRVKGVIFFDTTATGDFKYAFTAPAAPTLVRFERVDCVAGGTPAANALDVATPGSTALAGAGTTGGYVSFTAIFQNAANAALFAFQFAQNTATNDTGAIVRAGSYMEWSVVH